MAIGSSSIISFPYQKKSRRQKTKSFYKECIDAAENLIGFEVSSDFRSTMSEKISNINLINNIVDPEEVKRVVNPYKLENDFTDEYKNYPLLNSYLAVLLGEEREMIYSPMVTMTNPDLVNKKLDDISAIMNEMILRQVLSETFSEEEFAAKIQEQYKWMKFNYRDRRELMASQIIQYGYVNQNMKELFSKAFEDLLIQGEEIAVADIVSSEPVLRRVNPVNIYTIRSGSSNRIEDSDLIIEVSYEPVGKVIDEYFEELTDAQIKKLEEGCRFNKAASGKIFSNNMRNPDIDLTSWVESLGGIGSVIAANSSATSFLAGSYDRFGNVKKIRVLWKGMRKIGILTFYDEHGDQQKVYVDEDYPLTEQEKENVKWVWISEWYEGTKIADDIYVKMGPRPVQFRSMDNPSKCHPGIVGNVCNLGDARSLSFVSLGKQYQYLYNFFMHKLWEEMKTYKGKLARLSVNMIPSSFTMDQFLYFVDKMKIVFEDEFNEGKKGAALGKLAGTMNRGSGSIEVGDPHVIQNILAILVFLENRIADIVGITPQRKGAISTYETVGGVERSVKQSSLNTARYFSIHEDFRNRALAMYLETAKVAWKDTSFKRQFVLSDGSQAVLDFDSSVFNESEYGVYTTNAIQDREMMSALKSLSQIFLQNGGTLSMVMELYRTQDPASLQRKLEAFEEQLRRERIAREQASAAGPVAAAQIRQSLQNEMLELKRQKQEQDAELKREQLELERDRNERELNLKEREIASREES